MEQEFDNFTKASFARLLRLFENTDDVVKLTRAFSLAARTHKGEMWNKSEPFVNHSLRVALILAEELHLHDLELVCAALLHDIPVDQYKSELADFGPRVLSTSSTTGADHRPRPEARTEEATAKYYEELAKAPKDSRYIRLADRLDSARAMKNQGYMEKAKRFKEETQRFAMPIAEQTSDKLAFKLSVALYELK